MVGALTMKSGRNLAGTGIGPCFLIVDTSVTTLITDARYSGRYSSSCEPKHTLLLFKGFYWVIWSHGQGEQSLIYRNVLNGG